MNKQLQEMIAPRWIEEQQGVYIPLIDKVLLKDNVPDMPYDDYMDYAEANNKQIATKEELLQMYLQKDEINKILEEHNGDILKGWFGSSSESNSGNEWLVDFDSSYCTFTSKICSYFSRVVVSLKRKQDKQDMKQFSLEEYLKNPNRKIITRDGRKVRIICTDRVCMYYPIVALVGNNAEDVFTYTESGKSMSESKCLELFFTSRKHEGWINVYKSSYGESITSTSVFDTKEQAEAYRLNGVISTCKIEWEE